ncbi:g182 [Coccomyxa viridis]|uniref:G182 protein n=1 Tax=Coccomyxa viridis TaxID=1274662 RepID=A0ABP1FI26_9CHLO
MALLQAGHCPERVRQRKAALAAGQREADREDRRYTKKANHVIGTLGGPAADLKVGAVVSQARRTALASLGYDEDTKGIDLINMVNNWDETYNNTLDEPERMKLDQDFDAHFLNVLKMKPRDISRLASANRTAHVMEKNMTPVKRA